MTISRLSGPQESSPGLQIEDDLDLSEIGAAAVSSGNLLGNTIGEARDAYEKIAEIFESILKATVERGASTSQPASDGAFFVKAVPNTLDSGLVLSPGNASMESYAPLTSFPRHRREQLIRADYWLGNINGVNSGDDLLSNLMGIKTKFTALGLSLKTFRDDDTKVSTGNSETQKFTTKLKRIKRKWNWQKIVKDLLRDWFTKDSMILYWKVDKTDDKDTPPAERSKESLTPGLADICTLNPADCDWDNSYGFDILRYKIPKDLEIKIRHALTQYGSQRLAAIQALKAAGIQQKYFDAVDKGQQYVILDRNDGDNWLVATTERNKNGLAKPSMRFIFDALESRKCVKEGEFTAAFMMKHFIFQATTGESITQGVLAGLKNNWAKKKEIDALFEILKNTSKAQRLATNHTVKFNFIFPPKEMWDQAKYEKSEARIYDFAGVSVVVMTGVGGTNAGGYLSIKRMITEMQDARDEAEHLISEFFDNPEIRAICEVPDDVDVTATFDENALKEPKQLLDEIKFLLQFGITDPPNAAAELGRDPNTLRDSKLRSIEDNSTTKVWEPVFQPAPQGTVGQRQVKQDAKGRPPNDGTTQSEGTRQQSARASA